MLVLPTSSGATNCWSDIEPAIKALDSKISEVRRSTPKDGVGPQVEVGSCASRLKKLGGNMLGVRIFQNTAPYWEQESCLELKKFYLRQACYCGTKQQTFETDEVIQDRVLEVAAAATK